MAARFRVIVMDKPDLINAPRVYRYVFWADVPVTHQPFYVKPTGTKSAWKDATQADNDQLVSGAVEERVDTIQVPQGWGIPQMEAELQTRWQAYQDSVTTNSTWQFYGTTWNGTAWVVTGVA